jgi:hypothetical protein
MKKGLQLALRLDFLVAKIIYNSTYFYILSCIEQIALVATNTLYLYMELYIIGNTCNSMQLGVTCCNWVVHVGFLHK